MTSVALVSLWGTSIGTVTLEDNARIARFEYNREFLASGMQLAPVVMPLAPRVYEFPALPYATFRGLPGMLADSLPDRFGNAILDAWLEQQGKPAGSMNAVERLCYTGSRGMGALEFEPAVGPSPAEGEEIRVRELVDLASRILAGRKVACADEHAMSQMLQVGTSAGGARAKAVIAWDEQTGEVRSGQVDNGGRFGQWIIKSMI